MFKILDKRNGEVTAEQQAVFNKISTNNADGYVDGFLNSLRIAKMSSNVISIDSGLLSIQGFRSVNDTLTTYTVSVTPSEPIPFQLVATYSHYISDENDTLEITTRPTQELRREPLFAGQNAVYEVELAEFNMTADGIADFTVTLEKIVYNEQDLTELLDKVTKAEQDSATALEKVNELETQVIEKQGTAVYVGGEAQSRVNFTSDPQTQITANKNAIAEAQSDISDIIDGSQTVGKATQDANGNVIDTTYATKSGSYENLAVGALLVNDVRDVDNPPSFYYANGQKITSEFKTGTSVGIPDTAYCSLVTIASWLNDTGGKLTQIAYVGEKMRIRQSADTSTWGNWASVFATDPSKLAPSTANGWTQTTATGTLPSAGVYLISARVDFLVAGAQTALTPKAPAIGVFISDNSSIKGCAIFYMGGYTCMLEYDSGDANKWSSSVIESTDRSITGVEVKQIYYKRIA